MKKVVFAMVLSGFALLAKAQQKENYWVVETQLNSNSSVIRVYQDGNQLLAEISVDRVIDITRKRERRRLAKLAQQPNEYVASLTGFKRRAKKSV